MPMTAINLDQDTLALLDASASFRSLSREDALREAVEQLYADDLRLEALVEEGRACVAKGNFHTQEQIEQENIQLRKAILSRM